EGEEWNAVIRALATNLVPAFETELPGLGHELADGGEDDVIGVHTSELLGQEVRDCLRLLGPPEAIAAQVVKVVLVSRGERDDLEFELSHQIHEEWLVVLEAHAAQL